MRYLTKTFPVKANSNYTVLVSRLKIVLAMLCLSCLLLFINGCAVGPNYNPPKVSLPESWSEFQHKGETVPASIVQWWKAFNDPMLDFLISRAVELNLDLRVAEARVREARFQGGFVAADLWPSASTSVSYSRSRRSMGISTIPPKAKLKRDLYEAGFDASWEIDLFGGKRRAIEAARAEIGVAEENQRDVLVTLLAEVARNYIEVRGSQRRLEIVRKNSKIQQETVGIARARYGAGLSSELDVVQAEALLATTQSQIPLLENSMKQAIHRIGTLLGQEPGNMLRELSNEASIPQAPPVVPVGLPSDLLRRRPDVRRAERELAAATARIGIATADLFPKFSLTGAFGVQTENINALSLANSRFWSIGPTVRWSIFEAGRIRANIKVQNAQQEQSLLSYEKAVLASLEDVENAIVAYNTEYVRCQNLAGAVDSHRRAVDLARELFAGGLTNFLNVLDAERSLCMAEDDLAQSERTVSLNLVKLYKALGGGWETEPA